MTNLTKSTYRELIGEHFNYSFNFDFLDIVAKVLNRINDFTNEQDILVSIYDELIYTKDQWTILKFYSASPSEADWDTAMDDFVSDIMSLAGKIARK